MSYQNVIKLSAPDIIVNIKLSLNLNTNLECKLNLVLLKLIEIEKISINAQAFPKFVENSVVFFSKPSKLEKLVKNYLSNLITKFNCHDIFHNEKLNI